MKKKKIAYVRLALLGIVLIPIVLIVNGCSTKSVGNFCDIYSPVYTSDKDTKITETQVLQNMAYYLEYCL